jgi:acyl-coenzyme A thioesterase PaaI-like protein
VTALREIENVFTAVPGFRCFVCSPANDRGLKLRFFHDEETGEAVTRLTPPAFLSGFPRICHGGIQTTVLDELAFWAVFAAHKVLCMTAEIKIRFTAAVPTDAPLEARARAPRPRHRLSRVTASLRNEEGAALTEADILVYVPDEDTWRMLFGGTLPEALVPFIP